MSKMKKYSFPILFYSSQKELIPIILDNGIINFVNNGHSFDSYESSRYIYTVSITGKLNDDIDLFNEYITIFTSCLNLLSDEYLIDVDTLLKKYNLITNDYSYSTLYTLNYDIYNVFLAVKYCYENSKMRIAVLKYNVAQELYSSEFYVDTVNSLQPEDLKTYDKIRIAYAIICYYSIIEDIGLEIRASSDRPSVINVNQKNPVVVEDIKNRFNEMNIDVYKKILWFIRTNDRPFKTGVVDISDKMEYDNENIMDCKITYLDALYEFSHVRSKVASHGNEDRIDSLNIYDLYNFSLLVHDILVNILINNK